VTDIIKPITNRWLVIPIVLVLAFAAMLMVRLTVEQQQRDDLAAAACRPVCTMYLGPVCVGKWIAWRVPYPCYPY
jgi:hypothetical protein